MKTKHACLVGAVCTGALLLTALPSGAVTFSLDATSIAVPGAGLEDDLFGPGLGVPVIAGGGVPGVEVNAISYGRAPGSSVTGFVFSVDPFSVGAPGTGVDGEASGGGLPGSLGDQPADLFFSGGAGFNVQVADGDGVIAFPGTPTAPPVAPLGLSEFFTSATADNLDALDLRPGPPGGTLFWSVGAGTAGAPGPYVPFMASDIFIGAPVGLYSAAPVPYLTGATMGMSVADDIDGLVVFEGGAAGWSAGDSILFSLSPGSVSFPGFGGTGPGDIYSYSFGAAAPTLFASAASLGLTGLDDVDAFDIVPEPSRMVLLALGVLALSLRRRRAA